MIELRIMNLVIVFVLLFSLAFASTKSYTFQTKTGTAELGKFEAETDIKNNALLQISVNSAKMLKGNTPDSLGDFGSSDVICPTSGSTKATITHGWAVSKFNAESAFDDSKPLPKAYTLVTEQPIKWVSQDELTKLKNCFSDVGIPLSQSAENKECYNFIVNSNLKSQKATYIAGYDFQLNTPKQYPDREGLANVYCSGNAVLRNGGTTVKSWDLKDTNSQTFNVDLTKEGSYDLVLETQNVKCLAGLKQPTADYANIYNDKYVAIDKTFDELTPGASVLTVKDAKMSATAKVETTTLKMTDGGNGFLYITVTNTGTVPLKVTSINKIVSSGTGFSITAGEPAKDPFWGVDNDFNEPIPPGETGNIFATVTAPNPMPDSTNIKITVGIQALEPTCAKNDPNNPEVLLISGQFTAEEVPPATSCTLTPNSLNGETGKELSYKITCKDQSGKIVECPEQKFLDFKVSPSTVASFTSYAANNVKFKVTSTGTSTVTVSTKNSYPNTDFSCSAQLLGTAGEKDTIPTSCTLTPASLSGKTGEILNYQMSCTNKDGEPVTCSEENNLDFVFSSPTVASLSSYVTDSVKVLVKGTGETQFTVKTKAGSLSSYSCNAKVVGLEDADQINTCTITKPSKIEEDKKFSVSLTCFDKTKVISCNNVEWALSGFAANEATLQSSDNHAAFITLIEKDANGNIVASVDNKKFHCVEELAVTNITTIQPKITSCSLSPSTLTGKFGDTLAYHIVCKDSLGAVVECDDEALVEFKSSDENVAVFSSYTKKQVNVFVKNAGSAEFTVSSKSNNPNKYSCSASFVVTSPQQANSCVLNKPATIDLNKEFSVGVTCFDQNGALSFCKNTNWQVSGFKPNEYTLGVTDDVNALLTIKKEDAVGDLTANVNGKASCKTDLFVNGVGSNLATSCALTPGSLSGKPGDTLKYKITCMGKTGSVVECPHEGRLAFLSSNENVATFGSYDKKETNFLVKAPGTAQFTIVTTTYPNKFSCKSNAIGTRVPGINGTNGTTTADLVLKPPILFVQVGKRGLYNLDCFINTTLSSCPSPPEIELSFSTPNADLDTYKKDYFGPGKSAISVNGIIEGSSLIIVKWPKFNIIKTARIEVIDGNQTGNGTIECNTDPSSISIGLTKTGPVTLTCLNGTKPISCPLISVEFSNNNAQLQSYKKDVFGIGKDELMIRANSAGSSLMIVKSNEFTNACATSITIEPGNRTNVTSNITNSGTGCILSLPSVIEEDKQFSLGLSCFNDSSGSKKGVSCNNVEWSFDRLGPSDYTLYSTSDGEVVLTLTKEDAIGSVTANVDNKYSCAADIFVTKNLCTVTPSIWIAKPGDERTFTVKCKFEDTVEKCNIVQWNINQLGSGFVKKSDPTSQSKQTISAPKDANTFVDGKNIVVTAEGIDSGKEYLCTVKTYIASLICQDLV